MQLKTYFNYLLLSQTSCYGTTIKLSETVLFLLTSFSLTALMCCSNVYRVSRYMYVGHMDLYHIRNLLHKPVHIQMTIALVSSLLQFPSFWNHNIKSAGLPGFQASKEFLSESDIQNSQLWALKPSNTQKIIVVKCIVLVIIWLITSALSLNIHTHNRKLWA